MNTLAPGSQIGPYLIVAPIAQGGMGVVYHAKQQSLQRDVAIKILPTQFTQDAEFLARFERESRTLARLRHPNIVQVFDAGAAGEYHYIVMEYLASGTLAAELTKLRDRGDQMPIDKAIKITQQIAQALDYAHQKGVVHRDIKPSNILVADEGRYVLSDFGIVTDNANTKITRTMQTLGTPEYMSPEQANGMAVDRRSDVYSLGVVLYEMLTGAPPFSGNNTLSVLNKHLTVVPPSVSKIRVGIPVWLQSVVQKALEKLPEHRFQTAADFAANLQQQGVQPAASALASDALRKDAKASRNLLMPIGIGLGVLGMLAGVGLIANALLNSSGATSSPNGANGLLPVLNLSPAAIVATQPSTVGATSVATVETLQTATVLAGSVPTLIAPTLNPIPATLVLPTANGLGIATLPPVATTLVIVAPVATATTTPRPPTVTPQPPTVTNTPKPPTMTPVPTIVPTLAPVSGTCLAGYVYRLARATDKVCVTQAAHDQALADNAAAASRRAAEEAVFGPDTCEAGYVWREAFANDHVCVTVATRSQAASDNAAAAARREPGGGAFGPDTCRAGFVWREARANDHVCVTPATRAQAAADNAAANSRKLLAFGPNTCKTGFVWREAFENDIVCVTPATRMQVRNDNALAARRTVP